MNFYNKTEEQLWKDVHRYLDSASSCLYIIESYDALAVRFMVESILRYICVISNKIDYTVEKNMGCMNEDTETKM